MADKKAPLSTLYTPTVGIGCWQSPPEEMEQVIEWALDAGVRLIDTAYMYRNEDAIGRALTRQLKSGKVKREELFITTKLPMMAMRPENVAPYFELSRKALGVDYVDLYLIHCTLGIHPDEKTKWAKIYDGKVKYDKDTNLVALWKEMEKLVDSGKVRAIGISNFNSEQTERLAKIARIPIAVNQLECNAYFQQKKMRDCMDKLGIRLMAYAPIGSPGRPQRPGQPPLANLMGDPVVTGIAARHGKTPAQVLIRHLVQLGMMVIPKSVKQHRIKENFDVFDFELTELEMAQMNKLDKGSRKGRAFDMNFLPTDDDVFKLKEFPMLEKDEY